MPTYDYECSKCGLMEITHSIHDDAVSRCPTCGSKHFARQISLSVALHPAKDQSWENLNDGKGMFIGGLGKRTDRHAYCRSLNEATEKAKRLGKSYEIA
jgi:putative FmdB family regulatory protein